MDGGDAKGEILTMAVTNDKDIDSGDSGQVDTYQQAWN